MLSDKIRGCIYGYAIGDALGIGTEFMTRREIAHHYPKGLTSYDQIIQDAHRSQWAQGDFSFDTEQILVMADRLAANGKPDYLDFACHIEERYRHITNNDFDGSFRWVLRKEGFTTDPMRVSKEVYDNQQLFEARNEALGRAMIAGLWPGEDYEQIAIDYMRTTHWDPLGIASGVVIAVMANELLWHDREVGFDRMKGITLRLDERFLPYLETAYEGHIDDFVIDDEDCMWSAPKASGATLWALQNFTDATEALYAVVEQGGDADTIASLTLGLFGLKYGFDALPKHLVAGLVQKDRIEATAQAFIKAIEQQSRLLTPNS